MLFFLLSIYFYNAKLRSIKFIYLKWYIIFKTFIILALFAKVLSIFYAIILSLRLGYTILSLASIISISILL
jgi:hypothetical protein